MKKKNNSKNSGIVIKTIYPKEYLSYIISSMIIISTCIFFGYLASRDILESNTSGKDVKYFVIIYLVLTCIFLYYIAAIIALALKRIRLDVKETEIKISKIFIKRKILITDIESIYIGKISWKYPFSYVTIKRKKCGNKYSNRYLIFPVSWFSLKDIKHILEIVKSYNKKIKINGSSNL